MSGEMLRLAGSVAVQVARCQARFPALARSMERTAKLFPLGTELARTLSEDDKEALDAFVLRFIQCAAMAEGFVHGNIMRSIKETREALEAPTEDGGAYLAAVNRMPGVAAFLVSLVEWAPQEGWLDPSALPDEVDLGGGAS